MTIGEAFAWLGAKDPSRLAVKDDHRQLSRIELERESNQLARAYLSKGAKPESYIVVSLPNSVAFVVACVAIWKLGATPMPMSVRLPRAEREILLDLATPSLIVSDWDVGYGSTPMLGANVDVGTLDQSPLPQAAATSWKAPTTSGSTGRPKIVRATAGAWIDPQAQIASFIPRNAVQLVAGPLSHSAPFTYAFRGLMTGHSLVIHGRFDESRVLAEIARSGITWMMMVPTMMHRIMRLPVEERAAADLSGVESIVHLGAPCSPELKRQWLDWLGPERLMEVYAGTESQGLTAITGTEWLEHPGSVGRPIGGSSVQILNHDGVPVAPGTVGQVYLTRTGQLSYQYIGATSQRRGNWDSLGDLGYLDREGYLYLLDRLNDLIISGGVNIYPAEIEQVLEQHPEVRSAAAIGAADPDLGQRVVAVVDTATSSVGVDELMEWLKGRIDPVKAPKKLIQVNHPLRDDAGKVRRNEVLLKNP